MGLIPSADDEKVEHSEEQRINMSKSVLITGSSSGFGNLIAKTLGKDGQIIFATMRGLNSKNAEKAKALSDWAAREGVQLHSLELDVTDDASVNAAVKQAVDIAGKIDVVVNNAGILSVGINESLTTDNVSHLFNVNVLGPFRVVKAALPFMRKQKSGLFVHVSSVNGRMIVPFTGMYCATKHALEAFGESLRYDLALQGIDSVIVQPGAFPTEMGNNIIPGDDAALLSEYGEMGEILQNFSAGFESLFSGPDAPNPQDVADAVKNLIDLPIGKRPLRTVVDKAGEGVEAINNTAGERQQMLLAALGMKQLLNPEAG